MEEALKGSTITANEPVAMSKEPQQEPPTYESNEEIEGRSWRGIAIGASVVIILLLVGGGWWWKSNHDAEIAEQHRQQERVEALKREQAILEARKDSVWQNFQTDDLKLFELKGFVKEMIISENPTLFSTNNQKGSHTCKFNEQGILVAFDDYDEACIERNADGRISMIRREVYPCEECDPVYTELQFEYNGQKLNKVNYSTNDYEIAFTWKKYTFKAIDGQRCSSYKCEGGGWMGVRADFDMTCHYKDEDVDNNGNWIRREDSGKETAESSTFNRKITVTRVIKYYDRNEIDLNNQLN